MKILNSKAYLLVFFLGISFSISAQNSKFKVVLDAGHGGKDPGNSYHGYVEKNIALKTTIKIGEILEKENDIVVIYTRNKDFFVELKERANIANRKDANLFVSVHCNSVKDFMPFGTETFVMGMSRTNTNLDVAKSENSVILLEKDYKENYQGFDPNNPETLLGLKILQEEYLNQSIDLATKIEKNFKSILDRKSRGIKQQPLWVLDATYMPSVLIELGFLSNKQEGAFLNSDSGQDKMANAIANSILEYKKEYFANSTENQTVFVEKQKEETKLPDHKNDTKPKDSIKDTDNKIKIEKTTDKIVFKVQISAGSKNLDTKPSNFKGLKNVTKEKGSIIYKYYYEESKTYFEATKNLKLAKEKGYNSAFIVAFKNGEKINISEAVK